MASTTVLLADRYRLGKRIAAGGVGEVWRGTDLLLKRPVAVKLLRAAFTQHEETLTRFRAEARHAACLSHPGIAQVYDYCEDDRPYPPYLVMELVDGPSLAAVLTRRKLTPAQVMGVIAQAADGLAAAHAAGLVHRDIKPGNLLIGADGRVKITDFGISHAAGSAPVTSTGTLIGTPAYLAPERVAGATGTPAADLYALGIVGYECLTGHRPFSGSPLDVAIAHRDQPLPPLPAAIPVGVTGLISELTAKDPAARPGNAAEVARRAARLRSALAATAAPAAAALSASALASPALKSQTVAMPTHVPAAGGPAARHLTGWLASSRPVFSPAMAMACLAAAVVVGSGAVGWLLATALALPARPATAATGQNPPPARSAPHTVNISAAALAGQPLRPVRAHLRQLGLLVSVRWQPAQDREPGSVMAVWPTGKVTAGTRITLTGAAQPADTDIGPGPSGDGDSGQGPGPPGHQDHGRGPGGRSGTAAGLGPLDGPILSSVVGGTGRL